MVFEYSFWWILPALLLSLVVAHSKFRKLSKLPDIRFGLSLFISTLRFLIVFTLLLLLLNPALSILHQIEEKPLLIVAQDNSASILKNKDSLYYQYEYKASLDKVIAELEDKFEIVQLNFGASISQNTNFDFTENRTDISAVMEYAIRNFVTRKPEGMILLTDGIYNSGVNPRYKIPSFPVYAVGLGDTISYPDVYIQTVEADKFNFLNTIFPIKVEIAALQQKGQTVKCILRENGNKIAEKKIKIDHNNFLTETIFEVEAKRKGLIRYSIHVETDFSERTLENNKANTWINIIDNSAQIAVFATAPHPDIAAIVNAVNVSGMYRCSLHSFSESIDTLKAKLLILHNPDTSDPNYRRLVKEAQKRKVSIWNILTNRKNISDFARYDKHYQVNFNTELNEYATVKMNPTFPYFEFTDAEIAGFSNYPPVTVPLGEIHIGAGRTLFNQAIKNIGTTNGIISFYEQEGSRIAYFWGEGLWRWRFYSYQENGNHELFNTLVNKIVAYLIVQRGNERFIHDTKSIYEEVEEVLINAELYNDSYELINTPEVKFELKHNDKKFSYSLNRHSDKYYINLGNLPTGEYSYQLSTDLKGEVFNKKGIFYVRSHNSELNNIIANRALLQEITIASAGELFTPQELDKLARKLITNSELKPAYRSETEFMDLSRMKILGFILILLLCTEWFLLKYFAD